MVVDFLGKARGLEVKFSFEYKKRVRADFLRLVLFLGGQPLSNDFSLLFLVFLDFFLFCGKGAGSSEAEDFPHLLQVILLYRQVLLLLLLLLLLLI